MVREAVFIDFIEDFFMRFAHGIDDLDPELRGGVLVTVAQSFLTSCIKLLTSQAERDSANVPAENKVPMCFLLS